MQALVEGDIADLIASIEAADTQQRLEQSAAE